MTAQALSKRALIVALFLVVWSASPAAVAADDFKSACDLYAAKDYKAALPLFENVSKKYPANSTAHYYLAHTYLALGQKGAARAQYQSCLDCKPGAEVVQHCQKALASLGSSVAAGSTATATAAPADPEGGEKKTLSPQEAKLEEDKKWVQRNLQEKLERLKKEEDEALEVVAAGANRRYRRPDGTRVVLDIEGTNAVKMDFEERMNKAKEEARKKIESLH